MKKIIVLSVVIGLLSLIGCQNEPKNEPEKTPIMDEVLAGTWVNDVHGSETEKTENFTRLNKELSGTYSKK